MYGMNAFLVRVGRFFSDQCRNLVFSPAHAYNGKRLINHVIRTMDVTKKDLCITFCYMEPNCVSFNFKVPTNDNGDHECELNNATHEGHEHELKKNSSFAYHGAQVRNVQRF